jgi:hypothetical protein
MAGAMNPMSLFLVRIWHRDGGFHASVRGVGEEEPMHFDDARPLAEFLAKAAPTSDSAAAPAPCLPASGDRHET